MGIFHFSFAKIQNIPICHRNWWLFGIFEEFWKSALFWKITRIQEGHVIWKNSENWKNCFFWEDWNFFRKKIIWNWKETDIKKKFFFRSLLFFQRNRSSRIFLKFNSSILKNFKASEKIFETFFHLDLNKKFFSEKIQFFFRSLNFSKNWASENFQKNFSRFQKKLTAFETFFSNSDSSEN